MSGKLPDRFHGGRPTARERGGYPAVPHQRPPHHQPGSLDFSLSTATPEEIWAQLSETVRAKVNARAGTIVQWWASSPDGRPSAVVLGTEALVIVEPTVNSAGGRADRISAISLDATSFRHVRVQMSGGRHTPAGPEAVPGQSGSGSVPLERVLEPDLASMLGHLPPRAQELIQDPFLTHQAKLRYDYYYLRTSGSGGRGLGGATLQVWCYLTDLRTLTFAAGVGQGFRDGTGADSWDVACWRAAVVPPKR